MCALPVTAAITKLRNPGTGKYLVIAHSKNF